MCSYFVVLKYNIKKFPKLNIDIQKYLKFWLNRYYNELEGP